MEIKKGYEYVCYLLIFSLVCLGSSQIRNNFLLGMSFITQAVIIFGFMEIIEKGLDRGRK